MSIKQSKKGVKRIEKISVYRYGLHGETEFPLVKELLKSFQQLVGFCDEYTYALLVKEFLIFKTKMAKKLLLKQKSP